MKICKVIVLVWWFFQMSVSGRSAVVGPFSTRADCLFIRETVKGLAYVTPCWETKK